MDIEAADEIWKAALAHIQEVEPDTLAWARSIGPATFRNLRLKQFLSQYCFVVYASGFRYAVIDAKFPAISRAFNDFDPQKLAAMTTLKPVLEVFANERKAEAFLKGAKLVISDGFSAFKKRLQRDGVDALEDLPGIGPITKDHLAKNIGLLSNYDGTTLAQSAFRVRLRTALIQNAVGSVEADASSRCRPGRSV